MTPEEELIQLRQENWLLRQLESLQQEAVLECQARKKDDYFS
jgi:hypothetical protein